jgi:NADPH:quinone reductase-like Zn-dependent oxidoreductase
MGTQMIHAAVLHGLGQRPRYEAFPPPLAGEDEAVVTVTAAALKPSDRLMAEGVHYAHTEFPHVVGLDGVGLLEDGTRVAFMIPQRPYGGMAQETLVGRGRWLPVRDGVDDVTAAAIANPGMAAWKTVVWEAEVTAGQAVLVLGATGTSGRIAAQLAAHQGARVVVAGRNKLVLDRLVAGGADAAIGLQRPHDELAAAIAAAGPYDVVIDYLWGAPAEAIFAALPAHRRSADAPPLIRYIQVGMSAGDAASRRAGPASWQRDRRRPIPRRGRRCLRRAARAGRGGEIVIDVDPVPLSEVEGAWARAGSDRRTVFVP